MHKLDWKYITHVDASLSRTDLPITYKYQNYLHSVPRKLSILQTSTRKNC